MMQLSREIRFALVENDHNKITNSWGGWPATNHIVPQLRLQCVIEGEVDELTGYICNIKEIDNLLRNIITEQIIPEFTIGLSAEFLIRKIFEQCLVQWNSDTTIVSQSLHLTPYLSYSIRTKESKVIQLTQQFEFSASHRLHCDHLSAEENIAVFGKCNNPEGHGHNYVVEVSVVGRPGKDSDPLIELHQFESTVKELIIDRLDHKHLNRDVEYFSEVNPSVENITTAIWNWLNGQFNGVKLSCVKVYETPKTWAQYCG